MDDVDRRAGDLRHGDGAVHGFGFGARRTRERVVDGRGLAFGEGAGDDHVDDAAVFGVHADERAVLRGLREGLEDGGIVHHEDVGIGHEELETGDAFVDQVVHVFEAAGAQIGDDHVQAVIDARLAFGLLPPGVEGVAHAGAAGLDGEIDDAGGAAERRGASAGFEIVGDWWCRRTACRGGCGTSMPPGRTYMPVASMTLVGGIRGHAGADFVDEFAFDQDVGAEWCRWR